MDDERTIQLVERCIFAVLLVGISAAGYFYETYKGALRSDLLIALIIAWMLLCYGFYRALLWLAVKHINADGNE